MVVKDKIVTWFIRNVIIPKNEVINHPGFIVLKISMEKEITNLREIFLPELIISELEKRLIEKYKEKGKQLLYSAGKKFGYRYALISNYPSTENQKEHKEFSYFLVRYLEAIYASKVDYKLDYKIRKFELKAKDWIVCHENGLGYVLSNGVGAGML